MPNTQDTAPLFRDLPLEEVPCYLCGRSGGRKLVDDPPFAVWLCPCGFAYTSPRLHGSRIHEIYGDGYFSSDHADEFGYAAYDADLEAHLRSFRRKAKTILRYKPSGRVLDVGCAAGAFLKVMQDRGFEVEGLEVSRGILEKARARFGFERLHCGRLDEVDLPPRSYDVVALFDVIEHVTDPVAVLSRCGQLLRDDGILVVQTQDVRSLARRVLRSRWPHFKQLEHIYHFSPATLATALERAGFSVELDTRRAAGKYVSFADIADRAHRVLGIPRWLCSPLRLVHRRFLYLNLLDEMFVIARRRPSPAPAASPSPARAPFAANRS